VDNAAAAAEGSRRLCSTRLDNCSIGCVVVPKSNLSVDDLI
jgi:hypothetical protein